MKYIFWFLSVGVLMSVLDLAQVRQAYIASPKSESDANKFAELVKDVQKDDANKTLVAYKGCALTLKSKHSNYLPDKISFMKEGAGFIDAAALADPQNIEIRMIRMSVQENVPFIVNYRDNLKDDKTVIETGYAKAPKDIKLLVRNFIKQSESFSQDEKARYK
ncbi:hypothetical protein HUK80_14875 [Flavobacterium sp. MAH-1]|uniref:DUF302 domain-containing protein n=1 Tax=Flavobacterium agri TaxID=2743471 RepID=A0A7Y9C6L0_9FLAO|nr:hypothetical protein [Flavobacterium agri]NUY82186.1 hypothetical protein [Flavobacterium agri]NYA72210.1 hypothetical protein [Flavobacterium agri]